MRLKDYISKVLLELGENPERTYIEIEVVIYDRDGEIFVDTLGNVPEFAQSKILIRSML